MPAAKPSAKSAPTATGPRHQGDATGQPLAVGDAVTVAGVVRNVWMEGDRTRVVVELAADDESKFKVGERVEATGKIVSLVPGVNATKLNVEIDAPEGKYQPTLTCHSWSVEKVAEKAAEKEQTLPLPVDGGSVKAV